MVSCYVRHSGIPLVLYCYQFRVALWDGAWFSQTTSEDLKVQNFLFAFHGWTGLMTCCWNRSRFYEEICKGWLNMGHTPWHPHTPDMEHFWWNQETLQWDTSDRQSTN